MKSSFVALSIIYLALSTKSSLGKQAEPLLDVDVDEVVMGTQYYIVSAPLSYNQPTVWKVDDYDGSTRQWYITTNGVEGNAGAETLKNWLKFKRYEHTYGYKIVHCPSVCESCVKLYSNVEYRVVDDRV
ncbi:hypothetical protein Ddye_001500 [Dipteronia dyeriana]|uniref:Uncharacterized protein n=1 Tax=Dipteronia dyeriana TaxID=168575 RepID=A0AAD9XNI5_9ROSI|nr:hypothetical protein Ddye_001500 [Dipteronia dyeriana]